MNELIQATFDYESLPAQSAILARTAAERIKLRLKRTVEDIIEIGRELMEVKAALPHGKFLPWIAGEFEMTAWTANQFMNVADRFGGKNEIITYFKPTILYALAAPSTPDTIIEKAIEKADTGEKVTVADVKDWKAELEAERQAHDQALATEQQRSSEWREQWIKERDEKRAIELKLKTAPKPAVQTVEVIPDDYEESKRKLADLEQQLKQTRQEQARLVASQVNAKLRERHDELATLEEQQRVLSDNVDRMKKHLAAMNQAERRLEIHQGIIEKHRLLLIDLAAFLSDLEPLDDAETVRKWRKLSAMMDQAAAAIITIFGPEHTLSVIPGGKVK